MIKHIITGWVLSFALSTFAVAQEQADIIKHPDGQTIVLLSATRQVEVPQDLLIASLRFDKEDKTPKDVQNAINEKMAAALPLIKKIPTLKLETRQYYVQPIYNDKQSIIKWQGSQTIIIRSDAAQEVLQITSHLQEMGFLVNSLEYQLSQQKQEEVRDGLMEETITSLNERIRRISKTLSKSSIDLIEINVGDSVSMAPSMHYSKSGSMMAESTMTAPSSEPGLTPVSLTINAKAVIK